MYRNARREIENTVLPIDFFDVKRTPRGSMFVMRFLAFLVLASTLSAFVYIAYDTSLQTLITKEIMGADLTGKKGWDECTMISKVTTSYADSETAGTFDLVNVMGSKSSCFTDLVSSDPCAAVSTSGSAGTTLTADYYVTGMGTDAAGTIYFVSRGLVLSNIYTLYKYSPLSGTIATIVDSTTWTALANNFRSQLEISSTGIVFMWQGPGMTTFGNNALHWFDPSTSTSSSIGSYVNTFALDPTDKGWVMTSSIDSDKVTFDIYQFDSTIPSAAKTLKFTSSLIDIYNYANFLSFDASGNLWALLKGPASSGASSYNQAYNSTLIKIGASISTPVVSVPVCSSCSNNEIYLWTGSTLIRQDGTVETYNSNAELVGTVSSEIPVSTSYSYPVEAPSGDLWFSQAVGLPNINKLDTSTGETTALKSYIGGVSEWFLCGSQYQAAVPTTEEELNTACALNGVRWSAGTPGATTYLYFSDADYAALIPTCDSTLYTRICDVVGALPPYVCTKEESSSLTNYLGVAAANAELLYVFLVFLCSFVFGAIAYRGGGSKQDPGSYTNDIENSAGTELELAHASGDSSKNLALEVAALKEEVGAMKKEFAALKAQGSAI